MSTAIPSSPWNAWPSATARSSRHPIVGLRYFNVYGPGEDHKGKFASMIDQLAKQMRAGKRPRIFTAGEQKPRFRLHRRCHPGQPESHDRQDRAASSTSAAAAAYSSIKWSRN